MHDFRENIFRDIHILHLMLYEINIVYVVEL